MATSAVCKICGTRLTMWNRSGWPNKEPICTRCYRGATPEMMKQEAGNFMAAKPNFTADQVLHYGWGEAIHTTILHTTAFLGCVWLGAWFGGWILAMVLSFVPMFLITRADNEIDNFIDRKRVQMHDGFTMGLFWLIFWINYIRVMFQFLSLEYRGNPLWEIWLVPTILSPIGGVLVAWLTDHRRLQRLAEAIRTLRPVKV